MKGRAGMSQFVPIDTKFCAALVDGGDTHRNVSFLLKWLDNWISLEAEDGAKRKAVVFDIDDTLINRLDKPLPCVEIYKKCLKLGLRCVIITARADLPRNREDTARMLIQNDIVDWEALHLMPVLHKDGRVTAEEIAGYKKARRDELAREYAIIANIGDMWTDLVRFPLLPAHDFIWQVPNSSCCVLFPPNSHGEVAIKLPSHTRRG